MAKFIRSYFALLLTFSLAAVQAQEVWSLERCIQYAHDNNITIKQAQANVRTAQIAEKQAKASRLPNLNANISFGENFGRTIDPTSNAFSTEAITNSQIGINAGVSLYNGGLINHSIKQAGWDFQAATADAERTANDLGLLIASGYLNILLSEEQLDNARKRVEQSQSQLNVTQKLIDAGSAPMADKYNILAQVARDEQLAVQAQNTLDLAYLALKQYLQLEPDYDLRIERPEALIPSGSNPNTLSLSPLYQTALGTQAGIRASDFRVKSAEESVFIARSGYYPSISLYANLNSGYSSAYVDNFNKTYVRTDTIRQTIFVDEIPVNIKQPFDVFDYPKLPFFKQIDRNFGQGVGVSISIPIYQNGRSRLNVERARLGVLTAQMQQTQARQTLKNDIQTAIANARAARQQLDAAQKTFDATSIAYQNTEKRHALGAVNALDLTTAKNNRDIAENDLVVAKYDYLFKLKILDFYEGKELKLN